MGKLSPEEFLKKYKPSTIESVKDNRAGGAGSVALPNNFGESQYDKQATKTDLSNLEDFRGEVQPFTSQLANGLAKAIPNTGIRAVDAFATTLGALWGLGAGTVNEFDGDDDTTFSTGIASGVNNKVSQYLDGMSKSLGKQFPIYRTDEYEDAGVGRVLQSPFWTDTMTDAASFMASSLISGGLVTKGISALGKGMVGFSKAKTAINALEVGKNLGNVTKSTEMWKNLAASTFGATAEAGVESRETYNTIYDKVYNDSYNDFIKKGSTDEDAQEKAKNLATKQASSAANISMLTNTILVGGSTFMQFGKHFTNMTDDIIDAAKISSDGTYKGFKLATEELSKYQKAYQKLGLLADPATEAGQEGGQFFMSKFLENYYTGNDEERDSFLESSINALAETLSPDGIESMMAGAVLGGLGSVGKAVYDRKNKVKTEDDFVNEAITNANEVKLDEVMGNVFGEGSKILANQMSRSMEADKAILEAKRVNDEVGAGLIKTTDFGDFVTTRLRLGKFDEVTEYLNGIKESETEEVDKLYNSGSSTRLTDETKSAIVDNAIEQANKIKKAYDENTRRYGRIVAEEDIAKMSVAESILDYAKVEELKAVKILKDYGFDINEVLSKYKTPEEMTAMSDTRGILEKTYNEIKTDIDGRKKEGNYKGERAKELESTFNELSSITKQIENSLSDANFTTPFSIDGKNQIGNYKSIILKEINKKLNDIEQAAERNAGDLTEWQKLKDTRDSFIKIQDIKDGIIDIRNKFTKDPQKFSREASDAVTKSKASKAYNELFKIMTQPQIVKNKDGKASIDDTTSEPMILKPGLYYEGQGRVEGVYDKDGKQLVADGKRVWKNIAHAKRDFYDILETFIEVDDAGRPIPMIKYVNKGKEQVAPLELFKNGVLNPVYNKGEIGGVISEGLMTEEEAFYQKYRNNVIQYQYLFKNKENKLETKIIHGMLGYNAQGYMVVRFKNDFGYVEDTRPFRVEKRQPDGTVKIKIEVSNFQVAENEKPWYSKTNSQYLKILNEEQSKEWLFVDNLERTEQMYKAKLAKRERENPTVVSNQAVIDVKKAEIQELVSKRDSEIKAIEKEVDSIEKELKESSEFLKTVNSVEFLTPITPTEATTLIESAPAPIEKTAVENIEDLKDTEKESVLVSNGLTITKEDSADNVEEVIEKNNEIVVDNTISNNLSNEDVDVIAEAEGIAKEDVKELVTREVKKAIKNKGSILSNLSEATKKIINKIVKFLLGGALVFTVVYNSGNLRNTASRIVSDYINTVTPKDTISFNESTFSVTSFDGCSAYVSNQVKHTIGKEKFLKFGFFGDAWTINDNLIKSGNGTHIFNSFSNFVKKENVDITTIRKDIKDAVIASQNSLKIDMFQEGDIVNLFYEGSNAQEDAYKNGKGSYTSHIGIIKKDAKGNLVLEHNIHGIINKDSLSDLVSGKLTSVKGSMLVSGIVRPKYEKIGLTVSKTSDKKDDKKDSSQNPSLGALGLLALLKRRNSGEKVSDEDINNKQKELEKKLDDLKRRLIAVKSTYDTKIAEKQVELKELEKASVFSRTGKSQKMPFEDIILEGEKEIKKNLDNAKQAIQGLDGRTKEAKSLRKAIDSMEAKLSNITSYVNTLENEKAKLREDLQRVNDIITSNKQSGEFYDDLKAVKENLNKNRQHLIDTLEQIEQSNDAYESIKSLYYATLKDIKEQFNNIIDFDKFYESEYMSNVIASMNNPVLDVKYTNMGLVGSDFGEILNYLIDNNNKTVDFVTNQGVRDKIKLELSKIEEVGNEDLENKLAVLEETISNMGEEAIQLIAQLKKVNRKEFADTDTISTYDFYKTILQRLSESKNALTKDDTIFYGKGLKVDGYNDPFIASRREIKDAPKKSVFDSISTTSRQDITPYFPNNGSNEDKHQWVFQKFLADNDLTNDYLLEYLVDDVTDTSAPYIRNKSFDNDPTQKAILVRVVDTKGNPILFDNTGTIKADGIYQAIGVLEGGSGMERNAGSDTATKYTKFREVDELYKLKEDLVEEQDATKKTEIQSKITALEAEINSGLAKYQEVRDKIISVLDKGERFVTKPIEQSLGVKFEGKEELELKEAFGENFKQRIKKGELILDVVREPEYTLPTGDKINVRVGTVLIYGNSSTGSIKTPKVYFLQPKKNNDYNLNKIVESIKKFAVNEELKADKFKFDRFYDIVRRYIYWGSVNDINKEYKGKTLDETTNETDEELKDKLYHIRFKYGTNSQIVEFGDYIGKDAKGKPLYDIKEVSVKDIEGNEEFSKFIKSKNNHFSVKTLDKNLVEGITETNSPLATKLNGFTVNTQRSDKLKYKSQYVRGSNEQVESLKEKKKPVVPQPPSQGGSTPTKNIYSSLGGLIVNKTIELSNTLSYKEGVEQIKLWFESGVLKQKEGSSPTDYSDIETVLKKAEEVDENGDYSNVYKILTNYKKETVVENGLDNGAIESKDYESTSIDALNRLVQTLASKGIVTVNESLVTKPQQSATEKAVAIINNSQEAEPVIDPEAMMRRNHNLDTEPKLRIKDIRSLKDLNRYYGLTPKFVKGLIDGVGFGKIAQVAGDLKITVSQDAPLFAEYHEKFHLVELFLFNKEERSVIYDWFRKSFKNNNLTDKEVSEMMAEEFRYYSIERAAKENKTFGEMIFDYLRKIIDGLSQLFTYNRDPNIKSLFDAIYDETVNSELFKDTNAYNKDKVYGLGENFLQKQPFTREEIKSLQKHSLLAYYTELEKHIPNFSRFSFLVDGEYTKEVKQQYKEKMDIFQQFDNADTAILFNVLSSIEVANPYIAAKLSSYENKLDLAKNIKDYIDVINQNGVDIDEFIKETINQEFKGKDTAWDLEPTEIDFIKGGSSIVNMLLTTIPGDKNHLGLTEHIDINQSKVELHYLLKDIKNGAELLQKLKTSTTYWHNVLYSRLTDPRKDKAGNVVTVLDRNVAMMQVVTNFKKQIINFIQTNVKEDGVVTLIDKNRDSLLQRELYNFRNKFIFEHGITPNDYKNDVKVIELKNKLEKLKSLDGHHFLNSLGFDVDIDFEQYARENNINISNIIQKIKTYDLSKTDDFKNLLKDSSKVTRIKELAQIITDYKNEVTPVQVLSADNKPMYSIIERNFISKKLDELKRKFEGNDSIEAQRINDAEIVYNLGVSTENDVQKANKLTETPSFIMHINNMLHNISPFIATGDKSSYFGFKNLAKVYSQPIVEEEINDRYISLYKNILEQEFNTFVKYKSADSDMVTPLIDQHFGVSSVFNPSIDKMLFVNGTLRFTDFSSFYNSDNFKEGFEKAVIEYTEKKVESLTKKLYDSGIAEGDKINFVDKESLRQTSTYSSYDLAHKLHLFILESNYMQSKYMIGDIGFYGMNLNKRVPTAMATKKDGNYNVAVANLLKTHPVYGRKAQFDFNKTIDGELVFDALVHDDLFFKDEKLEKLFSKYGQTNIADGAAMEHIEAIRFREWSEGTWTQEDEDLYQLDLDGKLDDASIVKFTMKKTQYYGDTVHKLSKDSADTITVPTLYKMAVMPITNSIASKSKTLRDIKLLMEEQQVPLLMANSANKITRKSLEKDKGYQLFINKEVEKNGKTEIVSVVNNNKVDIDKFKQTSFWKYYNTQQDTHKDEKWEQTQGTQFSKQIFANVLEGDGILTSIESGDTINAKDIISNIDNLNVARVVLAKELLYERFDISKEKGGNKTASTKALLKEIKANLQQKDVPSTMIEEVIELLSNNKGLDTVLNSTSFEAVLTSLVNKMLIQPKKFGMPMAQAANIGFTQMEFSQEEGGNNTIKLNDGHDLPPLKAYIHGESEGLEVYLPSYFKEQIDISKVDSKLLRAIGFRIPTQSPNSIEKIIIKGFLPSNFSNMVIVPSSITTKSGSDFDIDKINIYLPNYYTDVNGKPHYVELLDESNSTLTKRYSNYIKRNVKGTKSLIKELKGSSEYKEYLDKIESAYERILKPAKVKLSDIIDSLEDADLGNNFAFSKLPNDVKQEYKEYNKTLNNRSITGLDKQNAFSAYTDIYIMNNNPKGELLDALNLLKATYDIQIELLGGITEVKSEYSDALGSFKINKGYLTDKINDDILAAISEFYNLESKETFGNRPILNQNSIEAIDNGIFENYLTILDSKEYRKQMLTPNSDKRIKDVSNEMRNREFKEKTSMADLMTIEHHIEAKQAAQLGKNILGQIALHSTHHILSQIANINISTNTPIFKGLKELHPDGVVNLDLFRDTNGGLISDTISELVNASVDVLKDPYIKYSEITEHNTGTFLYLLRTGVPLEDVVYFFNNPVIREYNKTLARKQFNSTEYNSTLHKDIIEDLRKRFEVKESLGILGNTLLKSRALADNIDYKDSMDYTVLNQFDQYFQTATALNDLMRTTKFDTSGMGTSFGETKGIVDAYNNFMVKNAGAKTNKINNIDNIFERDGVKTTMGVYRDVVSEAVSYFDSLYTSTMNKKIVANIDELFKTVKSDKQTQAYNKYISDFAAYVTQNYNDFPEYLYKNVTVTETDEKTKLKTTKTLKSVANEIERIKKSKTDPLSKNLFLNTIVTDTKEAFHKVLLLQGAGNSTNKYYSEQLSDSFTELMQYDAKLGYDIIKLAVMQDGFSKSPFSFLHLIPIEYKMELLDTFYTISDNIDLGNFDTKFKIKNHTLAFSAARVYKPEKFSITSNGYLLGKADQFGNRSTYVKVNNKTYEIKDSNVKELDMMIGRSITDYVSPIIESKPATMDDLISSVTDRYKKLEPKNCK